MANSIVDGTNINVNVFSYSSPKAHASGGKVVNLYNKYFKESLTISTPLMLTWGAQEGQEHRAALCLRMGGRSRCAGSLPPVPARAER